MYYTNANALKEEIAIFRGSSCAYVVGDTCLKTMQPHERIEKPHKEEKLAIIFSNGT